MVHHKSFLPFFCDFVKGNSFMVHNQINDPNKNTTNISKQVTAFCRALRDKDLGEIPRLNILMNGPRVFCGRMPHLTLSLFIIFKERLSNDLAGTEGSVSSFINMVL